MQGIVVFAPEEGVTFVGIQVQIEFAGASFESEFLDCKEVVRVDVGLDCRLPASELVAGHLGDGEVVAEDLAVAHEVDELAESEGRALLDVALVFVAVVDQLVEPVEDLEDVLRDALFVVEDQLQFLEVDQLGEGVALYFLLQFVRAYFSQFFLPSLRFFGVLHRGSLPLGFGSLRVFGQNVSHERLSFIHVLLVLVQVVDPASDVGDFLHVTANHFVVRKQTLLPAAILKGHDAHALLLVVRPLALVDRSIRLLEDAESFPQPFDLLPHVAVEFSVVQLLVNSIPVRPVLRHLPLLGFIGVVVVDEFSRALHRVVFEVASVGLPAAPAVAADPVALALGEATLLGAAVGLD
mmetsp:Transcript_6189/g.13112  ORF Transcript_6189/g.13112 Transcript_6189/m.13112 type:complete len:352 (-) Transcript_6189:360-1415(-)